MNNRDAVVGGGLVLAGLAMAWTARGFPKLGGMDYGPDLFPTIAAGGLMLSGAAIAAEGLRAPPDPSLDGSGRLRLGRGALVVALAFGFALALPVLGFHVAMALTLLLAGLLFGGGVAGALALAAIGTPLLHAVFYTALRVPLPWGVLTPLAW